MIGFEWKLGKFLLFCYLVFMCFTYFALYGMMVVALTPNYHIAAIVMAFFLGFWNLFTGFLIPRPVNDAQIRYFDIGSFFQLLKLIVKPTLVGNPRMVEVVLLG